MKIEATLHPAGPPRALAHATALSPLAGDLQREFASHLSELRAMAQRVLNGAELTSAQSEILAGDPAETDPERLSQEALRLAALVEHRLGGARGLEQKGGGTIPLHPFLSRFLSACEFLARAYLGEREGLDVRRESYALLVAAIRENAVDAGELSRDVVAVLPADERSAQRERVASRLRERHERREREAEQARSSDPAAGAETVREALRRAADPAAELRATEERTAREYVAWSRSSLEAERTAVAAGGAPFFRAAGAAALSLAAGLTASSAVGALTGPGAIGTIASIGACAIAMAGSWSLLSNAIARPRPAAGPQAEGVVRYPSVPEAAPEIRHAGSYTTRDPAFARRLGVSEVRVTVPPLGGSITIDEWLTRAAALHPGAPDLPKREELFRALSVPELDARLPLAEGETELTIPLGEKTLPLHPAYEVRAASYTNAAGDQIAGSQVSLEACLLGSFRLLGPPPAGAAQIRFRIGERSNGGTDPELVSRIRRYLPPQAESGTSELLEERRAVRALYPEDLERASRWIEHLKARGYTSCDDPALNAVLPGFGRFWSLAFHAHRTGNCALLAAHATSELVSAGTAAFTVSGVAPDSARGSFRIEARHAQSAVLAPGGIGIFDLTIGARYSPAIDLSRLSAAEQQLVSERTPPADADDAYRRALLVAKAIVPPGTRAAAPRVPGHALHDDTARGAGKERSESLAYAARVLEFRRALGRFEREGYRGLGEFLAKPETLDTLYAEPPLPEADRSNPELASRNWPAPSQLLLRCVRDILASETADSAEKRAVLEFTALRGTSQVSQIQRFTARTPEIRRKAQAMWSECLARGNPEEALAKLDALGVQVEVLERELPPLFAPEELIEIAPAVVMNDPAIVSTTALGALAHGSVRSLRGLLELCLGDARRLSPGQREGDLETCEVGELPHYRSAAEAVRVLEHASRCIGELERRKDRSPALDASFVPVLLDAPAVNSILGMRLRRGGGPDDAACASRLDEVTFEVVRCAARITGCPEGSAPLAGVFAIGSRAASEWDLPLAADYLRREYARYAGLRKPDDETFVLGAAAQSVSILLLGSLGGSAPKAEDLLRVVERHTGRLAGGDRTRDFPAFALPDLTQLDGPAFGIAEGEAPAYEIFRANRLSAGPRFVDTALSGDERGFFGPPGAMRAKLPVIDDKAVAVELARRLSLGVAGGEAVLTCDQWAPGPSFARIPYLVRAALEPSSELAWAAELSFDLGEIDSESEGRFRSFEAAYPDDSRRLRNRLRSLVPQTELLDSTGISIFDPDWEDIEPGPELSSAAANELEAAVRRGIAANAFHGVTPSDVTLAFEWLVAERLGRKDDSIRLLADAARAALEDASQELRDDAARRSAEADEPQRWADVLERGGFPAGEADAALRRSLPARAKVAALLTAVLYEDAFASSDREALTALAERLSISPAALEPLTRRRAQIRGGFRQMLAAHLIDADQARSCLTLADMRRAFGSNGWSPRGRSAIVSRTVPEFSDVVLRGLRSPPGEAGVYDSARAYTPGTPAQLVDWKTSERAGRLIVRNRVEELERPTVLVIDAESFLDSVESRAGRAGAAAEPALPGELAMLLKSMKSLSEHPAQSAVVLTARGVPLSVLLTPRSRLKHFFQSNPDTSAVCRFVGGFATPGAVYEIGRRLSACRLRSVVERAAPGGWRENEHELSTGWVRGAPKGVRIRILANRERLAGAAPELAERGRALRANGGEIELLVAEPNGAKH